MKKVAIDVTSLSDQYKHAGIGTYTKNLVSLLTKSDKYEWHLIGFEETKSEFGKAKFWSLGEMKLSTPSNLFFFKMKFLPIISKIKPDLYFAPNFERGLPAGNYKVAVMIHDISPYLFNKYSAKGKMINFLKGLFYKHQLKKARKADLVLTNSYFTKSEILKKGFDREKVKITHLGISEHFFSERKANSQEKQKILDKYGIEKPYILYYGGLEQNKNIKTLLGAYKKTLKNQQNLNLVIFDKSLVRKSGSIKTTSELAKDIYSNILRFQIEDKVILPGIFETEDAATLLSEAVAFVHLSMYEGFGLSVLEAMASGALVVAADKTSYPEVVDGGGLLVEPENIDDVVGAVEKAITDRTFQNKIRKIAKKRAEKFTWESCASQTLSAFDCLL